MENSIQTVKQLNQFVERQGLATPHEIINKLTNSNIIINHNIAKLIAKELSKVA